MKSAEERFWNKVNKTESCWLWTGEISTSGYARFHDNVKRTKVQATRWVFERLFGPVPDDQDICHRCDVRECVNPNHLFLGSRSENMKDAANKGRLPWQKVPPKGVRHPRAKFTDSQVLEVRKLAKDGISGSSIARLFNVDHSTVNRIIRGDTWDTTRIRALAEEEG